MRPVFWQHWCWQPWPEGDYWWSMPRTHALCRNNALIPYRARPGREFCLLEYPYSLQTAKEIIYSVKEDLNSRMRLCPGCHRYVTLAPSPDLGHGEVQPGVKCNLPHHPSPCPWQDRHGQPCTYQHPRPAPPPVSSLPPLPLSPAASLAPTYSQATGGAPAGDQTLLQQLEELRREKEKQEQRAEQLAVANSNLSHNQQQLSQQLL